MTSIRGIQRVRAKELQKELDSGVIHPFKELFISDIGDSQAMGQKPVSFIRQVTSLCLDSDKVDDISANYPKDVKKRVKDLLNAVPGQSIGTYGDEQGIPLIRQHVAEYIKRRDGGIPSDPNNIVMSTGASGAIVNMLSLFAGYSNDNKCGVLVPVPQYPLYQCAIAKLGLHQIDYHLNEEQGWSLDIAELENVVNNAKQECDPKVLVVINPGNPTGQVLTRHCIEEIVKFAYRERLYIFADEVYQLNVFQRKVPFHSFKKVMSEMGPPYSTMELASFNSASKGYSGECGIRGGYVELFNPSSDLMPVFNKLLQSQLCPSAMGQVVIDCIVNEPVPGDPSYAQFAKEKKDILDSLKRRSEMVSKALNTFKRVTCNPVMGSMYAFPRLHLPQRAIDEAYSRKMEPDGFYVIELLNATGICVGPGYSYGQKPGTYHFRMTILSDEERMRKSLKIFKEFNDAFMTKYE